MNSTKRPRRFKHNYIKLPFIYITVLANYPVDLKYLKSHDSYITLFTTYPSFCNYILFKLILEHLGDTTT